MVSAILINKVSVKRLSGLVHEVRHAVSVRLEKIQVRQRSVTVLQVLLALRLKRLAALSLYQGPAGLTFKVLVLSGACVCVQEHSSHVDLLSEDALADTVDHCITSFATSMITNTKLKTFYIVCKLKVNRPVRPTHVVPNSNPLGINVLFQEFPYHLNVNATL